MAYKPCPLICSHQISNFDFARMREYISIYGNEYEKIYEKIYSIKPHLYIDTQEAFVHYFDQTHESWEEKSICYEFELCDFDEVFDDLHSKSLAYRGCYKGKYEHHPDLTVKFLQEHEKNCYLSTCFDRRRLMTNPNFNLADAKQILHIGTKNERDYEIYESGYLHYYFTNPNLCVDDIDELRHILHPNAIKMLYANMFLWNLRAYEKHLKKTISRRRAQIRAVLMNTSKHFSDIVEKYIDFC
jgi:hypothetical protein